MQPVFTHVPPNLLRSMTATDLPAAENRAARDGPAWPVPMMIASKRFIAVTGNLRSLSRNHQARAVSHCEAATGTLMHEKERWPLISATGRLSDNLLFANSYEPAWGGIK